MSRYRITGGRALRGTVSVSGSRQAALWMIIAGLLTDEKVTLVNVPHARDVEQGLELLRMVGAAADWTAAHEITLQAAEIVGTLPVALSRMLGVSPLVLSALVARVGQVNVPGLTEVERLKQEYGLGQIAAFGGQTIATEVGYQCYADQLQAAHVQLPEPDLQTSVQLVLLAATANGETILEGIALDPELQDLLLLLEHMGVEVEWIGERHLRLRGLAILRGVSHRLAPDCLPAVFYGCAAMMTGGDILLTGVRSNELLAFLAKLQQLGGQYQVGRDGIRFWAPNGRLFRPVQLEGHPYPELIEAWVLLLLPLLVQAQDVSLVRFHTLPMTVLDGLRAMGGELTQQETRVTVFGPVALHGVTPLPSDRHLEVAALCLAALAAKGVSVVAGAELLDGLLDHPDEQLRRLGGKIQHVEETV